MSLNPFSSSASAILASHAAKALDWRIEMKTNHPDGGDPLADPGSDSWLEIQWTGFKFREQGIGAARQPSTLDFQPLNAGAVFNDILAALGWGHSNEREAGNRTQLVAQLRLWASIGGEQECIFDGRAWAVNPADARLTVQCQDWRALLSETEASVNREPDSAVLLADDSAYRQLALLDSDGDGTGDASEDVWAFANNGSGTDVAYDTATQSQRRSWKPGGLRLFYDSALTEEVPGEHWQPNWTAGAVQILEDPTGHSYYLAGPLEVYEEGLDWAEVVKDMLACAASEAVGGIAATSGDWDIPDTGLYLSGAFVFPAEPGTAALAIDCWAEIQRLTQQNLDLKWDPSQIDPDDPASTGKWKLAVVTQQPSGSEDWTLYHAASIAQPRDITALGTRIVATGYNGRPLNALAHPDKSGIVLTVTDLSGSGAEWRSFDGSGPAGSDDGFAAIHPLLFDGDHAKGFILTGISGQALNDWQELLRLDFGSSQWIQRLQVRMSGSRNVNSGGPHNKKFWPGVQVESSVDASGSPTNWRGIAAQLGRIRHRPAELIDIAGRELLTPLARHLKLTGGSYKFGIANEADPGCGCAELVVLLQERFRVVKAYQDSDPDGWLAWTFSRRFAILAADAGAESFRIDGDFTAIFPAGTTFAVTGSTAGVHDGVWVVASVLLSGGDTYITVTGDITSASASGTIISPVVSTYAPGLVRRFSPWHRTLPPVDYGDQYPAAQVHDLCLQALVEAGRVFRRADYSLVADPRIRVGQTVAALDDDNGDLGSILVDSVEHSIEPPSDGAQATDPPITSVGGCNWLEEVLSAE